MDSYDVLLLPEHRFLAQIAVGASGEPNKNIFLSTGIFFDIRSQLHWGVRAFACAHLLAQFRWPSAWGASARGPGFARPPRCRSAPSIPNW